MEEMTHVTIGADAICSDGICGKVSRVVLDPTASAVTHLVVEPKHRQGLGRLVPLDLVEVTDDEIHIDCTQAQFDQLAHAEETEFLPVTNQEGDPETGQALFRPYSREGSFEGIGVSGTSTTDTVDMGVGNIPEPVIYDIVPAGEVMVRRGDRVHATDGDIGEVRGVIIDPRDRHLTHVLLQERHFLDSKEVAIPINDLTISADGLHLNMEKRAVRQLPPTGTELRPDSA